MTSGTPTGPSAALAGPVDAGRMIPAASVVPVDLTGHGYVTEEFFASGTASAYEAAGPLERDGTWSVQPSDTAPYRTRIIVRRPTDPDRFNGTVLVEWFNVSGGVEAEPDWTFLSPGILSGGYAHVGVSAQAFGVNGGGALVEVPRMKPRRGLVATHPARYETLHHPGDRFAFDIFSQIGRALRASAHAPALAGPRPQRLVGIGESQSAFFLCTYINAVQPIAHVFDGFLVHSRGGSAASLTGVPVASEDVPRGVRIRSDTDVPVFIFQTETDLGPLLDYGPARQPDSDRIRTWEVAGTSHGDSYTVAGFTELLGCDHPINEGPQHFVAQAAMVALERWIIDGTPPPTAPALQLTQTDPPYIDRDRLGNALGGVRTPSVDVPVAALSGDAPPGASRLCSLFGTTVAFDGDTLVAMYGDKRRYLAAYERSLDEAITRRFLLESDRQELLELARAVPFPP